MLSRAEKMFCVEQFFDRKRKEHCDYYKELLNLKIEASSNKGDLTWLDDYHTELFNTASKNFYEDCEALDQYYDWIKSSTIERLIYWLQAKNGKKLEDYMNKIYKLKNDCLVQARNEKNN